MKIQKWLFKLNHQLLFIQILLAWAQFLSGIKRDLLLKNNQIVKQSLLDIDYNALQSLPMFSTVMPPKINYIASDNILVSYKVKPKKPNRFDVGIEELEDDEGVALFAKLKRSTLII